MTINKPYMPGVLKEQLVVVSLNKESSELTGLDRSSSFTWCLNTFIPSYYKKLFGSGAEMDSERE